MVDRALGYAKQAETQGDMNQLIDAIKFLKEAWMAFPEFICQDEYRCNQILNQIEKNSRYK